MTKFLSIFGGQHLVIVNYACGFNQSETKKCLTVDYILLVHAELRVKLRYFLTCTYKRWVLGPFKVAGIRLLRSPATYTLTMVPLISAS